MPTKRQHYVPRVYLSSWETTVVTDNEPNKPINGIYVFNKDTMIGEGCTRNAVLWKPHLYTISFNQIQYTQKWPAVINYFVNEVHESMVNNQPKPVYAKLGYSTIKTKKSIRKHILQIDEWDFYYYDGNLARSKGLIDRFKNLNCYIIEEALDRVYENKWIDIKDRFISEVKASAPFSDNCDVKRIKENTAIDMVSFFFMMFCRSPQFDPVGVYSWLIGFLKGASINRKDVDKIINAFWHKELYSMVYENRVGFYNQILGNTIKKCQLILIEAYSDAGSFITSDNPAFLHNSVIESDNNRGLYFPIDSKHLLIIAKGDGSICDVKHRLANAELVKRLNRIIYAHKMEAAISCEKNLQLLL